MVDDNEQPYIEDDDEEIMASETISENILEDLLTQIVNVRWPDGELTFLRGFVVLELLHNETGLIGLVCLRPVGFRDWDVRGMLYSMLQDI